ncbi:MAG: GH32 C-terminal domain-containing protein, partial [Anaerolineae bacterium]|nr:GH32 C-terminal domain-containing protein [Anaerolineae bacterium]
QNGRTWECPNFFPLGDQWVLILSAHIGGKTGLVFYFVGRYEDHQFVPEVEGTLDHAYLYAPLTTQDDQGRRLLWGWLREGRPVPAQVEAGWSGVQSVPRMLTLLPDHHLGMEPVSELAAQRGSHHHYADIDLSTLAEHFTLEPGGRALDIEAEFTPGQQGTFGLNVLCAADDSEYTSILYDAQTQQLRIEREHSSLDERVDHQAHSAAHVLAPDEPLQLRILVDGSVIEVIANQRTSITSRVYPTRADSVAVRLVAHDSDGRLRSLHAWEIRSIWPA